MDEHLFPNFLQKLEVYREAERFWIGRWAQLMQQSGQGACWRTPWGNTSFADGTPFLDGNPIFSAIRSDGHIAIRVIQVDPAESPGDFTYWHDQFGEGEARRGEELVISCALTKENGSKAIELMKDFVERSAKVPIRV